MGGRTLSSTRLSGNKFWKALIWKYSAQLLAVEEVPEYMKEVEKSGNLVTANHVSRNRKNITCSACCKHDGSKHHGHDKQNLNCPQKKNSVEPKTVKKRERHERKVEAGIQFHKRALSQSSDGTTFGRNVQAHMEPLSEPTD